MRIQTGETRNRKELAMQMGEILNAEAIYDGVPEFTYSVGPVKIERDGVIVCDDPVVQSKLMPFFVSHEWIVETEDDDAPAGENADEAARISEQSADIAEPESGVPTNENLTPADDNTTPADETRVTAESTPAGWVDIKVPAVGVLPEQIVRLIFTLYVKQNVLNHSFGKDLLRIPEQLVNSLQTFPPEDERDLTDRLAEDTELRGFSYEDHTVSMTFPNDPGDPDGWLLYLELMKGILRSAFLAKRVNPDAKAPTENEKYYVHSWLQRMGFGGPDFKALRKQVLRNLKGYSAFANDAAAARHKEKYAELRRIRREIDREAEIR